MFGTKLSRSTAKEKATAAKIQREVERVIAERGLSNEALARLLDLLPLSVEKHRACTWSLQEAWRMAEALDIPLELQVGRAVVRSDVTAFNDELANALLVLECSLEGLTLGVQNEAYVWRVAVVDKLKRLLIVQVTLDPGVHCYAPEAIVGIVTVVKEKLGGP